MINGAEGSRDERRRVEKAEPSNSNPPSLRPPKQKDENQSGEAEEGRKEGRNERTKEKWIGAASEQSIERKRRETRAVASAGRGKLTESLI